MHYGNMDSHSFVLGSIRNFVYVDGGTAIWLLSEKVDWFAVFM